MPSIPFPLFHFKTGELLLFIYLCVWVCVCEIAETLKRKKKNSRQNGAHSFSLSARSSVANPGRKLRLNGRYKPRDYIRVCVCVYIHQNTDVV